MSNHKKTMKDVVVDLRRDAVSALLELFELDVAIGEVRVGAHSLAAALHEIAAETLHLAETPSLTTETRLRALAEHASNASRTADTQANALAELSKGLKAWSIG